MTQWVGEWVSEWGEMWLIKMLHTLNQNSIYSIRFIGIIYDKLYKVTAASLKPTSSYLTISHILASLVLHVTPVARSRIKMASKLSLLPFGCLPVNWAKGCSDLVDKRNATCARVSLSHPKMLWNTPLGFEMVVGSWLNGQLVYNDHFFCFHHRN